MYYLPFQINLMQVMSVEGFMVAGDDMLGYATKVYISFGMDSNNQQNLTDVTENIKVSYIKPNVKIFKIIKWGEPYYLIM